MIEKEIQKRLQNRIGGHREVPTTGGYIDLLTDDEIIEVKTVKKWKDGVGQLMVYSGYFPSRKLRLHLFGKCHRSYESCIISNCTRLGIEVSFEGDYV